MKIDPMGGQAVIEGVLMRSKKKYAIAVRLPDGKIKIKKDKIERKHKAFDFPFIRGFVSMVEALKLGISALTWSSDQQSEENEQLTPIAVYNLPDNALKTLSRTSLKDTSFQLIKSLGEVIIVPNALEDPNLKSLNNKYKYITYISWPIFNFNKKLIGSIQIGSRKEIPIGKTTVGICK